ncbi:hypothetical protein [Moraxella catarrhalis]|nr:hypothetical protein [Moraxella catarrhalis]
MSLCDCVPTRQANKLNLMGGRLQVWICWGCFGAGQMAGVAGGL